MSDQAEHLNQIFICYRREDSAAVTGRIYDRLVQKFGRETIFKDVDSMPLGVNFRTHLDDIVSKCAVVLVVIGDRWVERLEDPRDFVRIEIESALRRDIPVVPLLVQGASLPPEEGLPESIRELSDRNGLTIGHDPHFHGDVQRLISGLEATLSRERVPEEDTLRAAGGAASGVSGPAPPRGESERTAQPADAVFAPAFSGREELPQEPLRDGRRLRWASYGTALLLGALTPALVTTLVVYTADWIFGSITYNDDHGSRQAFVLFVGEIGAVFTLGAVGCLWGALRRQTTWSMGLWLSAPLFLVQSVTLFIFWMNNPAPHLPHNLIRFISASFITPLMPLFACVGVHLGKLYAERRLRS